MNLQVTNFGLSQIDDTVSGIFGVLRKARNIKNYFAPINQLLPETLTLAATFFPAERDLLNATAVCQRWRTTLLSFPRLWRNAGGSLSELEAYLERSKSVPIKVSLSSPQLVTSIIPHTFRLVALTVFVDGSSGLEEITEHLRDPIPTLRSLEICGKHFELESLKYPSGLYEGLFQHLNMIFLPVIPSFRGPQTFPHITELSLYANALHCAPLTNLLDTLERLPGLVKVSVGFQSSWWPETDFPRIVTLPRVQEMHLFTSTADARVGIVQPILPFLKLPKVTSVTLGSRFSWRYTKPILPVTSFGEQLPNYVELPELRIDTTSPSGTAVFRSPSQAVLTYHNGILQDYHQQDRVLWGGLPLSSVRRVTAVLMDPEFDDEDVWLVDMLGDLDVLELLELGGDCGWVLRRLGRRLTRGAMRIDIKTLIVRSGEYARRQALKLERVKDGLGLQNMTVTYILDPEVDERLAKDPGVGDDEAWDVDTEEDSDDSEDE